MMIVGKEELKLFKKVYNGEDDYGNPIETFEEFLIKNVLVGKDSAPVSYTLFEVSSDVDLTVFISKEWNDIIEIDDLFEYKNERYQIYDKPVLWETYRGSKLKPKLIIGLKRK